MSSPRIGIIYGVLKVLLLQPLALFLVLRNIDPFYLEDHRPGTVITAGNHHTVIVCPALHYGAALQCRINIPADGIPRFTAEFSVHQMVKVILLRRSLQDKFISCLKERTGAGLRISQIFFLQLWKDFRF